MLIMDGNSDDEHLDILTTAIEAALKAAVRQPWRCGNVRPRV
jgi:hypothetical protein